jgi:hypothetical protein
VKDKAFDDLRFVALVGGRTGIGTTHMNPVLIEKARKDGEEKPKPIDT